MNPEQERHLEQWVDRELKALPELEAPATLSRRVLQAIDARARLPWYRRAWQDWPLAIQAVSLASLTAVFAGICVGSLPLVSAGRNSMVASQLSKGVSVLNALWHMVDAVFAGLVIAIKNFGTVYLVAALAAMAFSYVACVALGTVYVRIGLARNGKDIV